MKKVLLALSFLMVFGLTCLLAQTRTITGTVTGSDDGMPIPGASVFVKGTTVGTVTQGNGTYTLSVPQDAATVVVSFVGMQTQEVAIAGRSAINVALESSAVAMDEVVVVAYGTSKKSSFTGAASTVGGESLSKMQSSNLTKSLEGNVAGVQISQNSGQPGDGASMIIRGLGSISASQQPLIVVDGVPYEGSLNSIPTQDIENLTVLKDAAANSMYGARGSNGVIIITTKKGVSGEVKINFDAKMGWNTRAVPTYDIIDGAGDYYEMIWESLRNSYVDGGESVVNSNYLASQNLIDGTLQYNVFNVPNNQVVDPLTGRLNPNAGKSKFGNEWSDVPFKSGKREEYSVNFSGGTDDANYYASVGYLGDEGYIDGSDFNRFTGRLKVEQDISSFMKVGGNVAFASTTQNTAMDPDNLNAYSNVFFFSQSIAPIYPVYLYNLETGEPILNDKGGKRYDFGTENGRPFASEQNPVSVMQDNLNEFKRDVLSSRGFVEFNFLKDFKFTANLAYDLFNSNNTEFDTPNGGDAANVGGRGYKYAQRYSAMNTNQLLNYTKEFGLNEVTLLLGHETKQDELRYLMGHMTNFVNANNPEFANASSYQDLTSYRNEYHLEGYFSRLEYDFNDRYYVSGSFRKDGSSRFHPDNRWGTFWSVGASWRVSEEGFMQGVDAIDNLKLKASYGSQGNDALLNTDGSSNWYAYNDIYEINRVDDQPAMNLVFRGNPDLTWEKSFNFNAGIEALFLERISFNADFFIKEVKDLLYQRPLAGSLGNPSWVWRNELDMKNTGFEFDLGIELIKTNDLKWNFSVNGTHYKNELTKLPSDKNQEEGYQVGRYWREIGGTIYDFYTYEYAGVDVVNGKPLYNLYTTEDDGSETVTTVNKTSDATLRKTGKTAIPDFTGGAMTTIDAYGFDLSIQSAFQFGGYVWDTSYQGLMNGGERGDNMHKDMFKRWNANNRNTDVPALLFEDQEVNGSADRWLTDASYFSLRNITFGYSFPKRLIEAASITKLRVYFAADNVWFNSQRTGLDPRQNFSGTADFNYSALRTVSFGVQIGL